MGAVELSVESGLATCRFSRGHGNALNPALIDEMLTAFQELEGRSDVRGVLLASSGKLFCPGLDLQELVELDRPAMTDFIARFNACILTLFGFSKPLVVALHSHAVAGGCVLALTADWRVLAEGAKVGLNEVKVGVPFPFGVSMILRERIPTSRLTEVALLGNNFQGAAAVEVGLADELAPAEGFEPRCLERLQAFAERDPYAFSMTKRYLRSAAAERIRAHDTAFVRDFLDGWFAPATRERIQGIVASLQQS